MLLEGCVRDADGHQVDCRSCAAEERAEQLANFQLFGVVFLAFVYVLGWRRSQVWAPGHGGGA
jgi:hypothetical protein